VYNIRITEPGQGLRSNCEENFWTTSRNSRDPGLAAVFGFRLGGRLES
jgi:hypothetical protein